jgi:hypothetical protein
LVDREGKILQAKTISFGYEYFSISEVLFAIELEDGNFELTLSVYLSEKPNQDSNKKCIRFVVNWKDNSINSSEIPISANQNSYYYGKQNYIHFKKIQSAEDDPTIDYQAGDYQLSIFDLSGKTKWTKIITMPEPESSNDYCYFFPLTDGTFLITKLIQWKNLFLTRLDQDGKVIWESKIDRADESRILWINSVSLLRDGEVMVRVETDHSKVQAYPALIFDTQGNLKKTLEMNQKCNLYNYQILTSTKDDFWLVGDTSLYSFGESSAFVFYLAEGLKNALFVESDIKFTVTKASIDMESIPNEPDLLIQPIDLKASTISRDQTSKPVLALTKELCP